MRTRAVSGTRENVALAEALPVAVREGIYLFAHGIDPYSGGTFRHVSHFECICIRDQPLMKNT